MSRFQQLSISHLLAKKLALTSIVVTSLLLLGGCTGDSLDAVTTNADGTANVAAQDQVHVPAGTSLYMVELKWQPPATRTAGNPMSAAEIKYYRIRQHADDGSFITTEVPGNTTRAGIPVLAKGTYKFSIIAVDTNDRESDPTPMIAASIQ